MSIQALSGRGNIVPQVTSVNPQLEAGHVQVSCDLEKGECCDPDGRGISLEQSWLTWVDGLLRRSTTFRDTEIVPQAAVLQLERRNGPRQHRREHPHSPESKHPALPSMAAATFSPP